MSQPADPSPTRRVPLPTGESVDVVYVQRDDRAPHGAETGLHVCPACTSPLVAPVAWEPAGPSAWAVTLQCPNCEWWDADLFDDAAIERFDEELDRGTEALVRDLLRLTRANLEDDIERFVAALHADAILPEDF
jgi:hypothetical protein